MGFEVFLVELHGTRANFDEAKEAIRKLAHVEPDPDGGFMPGATYYVFRDGAHTIEMELMAAPVRLSCRFTLCHPPSVDAVFLNLVRELMTRLGMQVTIRENVSPEHAHSFTVNTFAEFSEIVLHYIAARRAEWIADFGDKQKGASSKEQFEEFILPQCQPMIEQPT
jgi:hypothetical protein